MEGTIMDNSYHHDRITLSEPGELIAGIPHLLGFHPVDSMVVVCLGIEGENYLVLRADLPSSEDYAYLAKQLMIPLACRKPTSAILVVIGGADTGHDEVLPHRELVAQCEARLADIGVSTNHQLWTDNTTTGTCWRSYQDAECAGFVPEPHGAFINAQVVDGVRIYQRREDLVATLAPVAEEDLARRAQLLATTEQWLPAADVRTRLRLVDDAVQRSVEGVLPELDGDILSLIVALSDHDVRDACVWQPDPVLAEGAERLWSTLVRNAPVPERAEPASLLAFSAYQRGAGPLTSIALDIADAADPEHRLTGLLHGMLALAFPPGRVRSAGQRAASIAREAIAADTGERSS
jgi:hypothetical protein